MCVLVHNLIFEQTRCVLCECVLCKCVCGGVSLEFGRLLDVERLCELRKICADRPPHPHLCYGVHPDDHDMVEYLEIVFSLQVEKVILSKV